MSEIFLRRFLALRSITFAKNTITNPTTTSTPPTLCCTVDTKATEPIDSGRHPTTTPARARPMPKYTQTSRHCARLSSNWSSSLLLFVVLGIRDTFIRMSCPTPDLRPRHGRCRSPGTAPVELGSPAARPIETLPSQALFFNGSPDSIASEKSLNRWHTRSRMTGESSSEATQHHNTEPERISFFYFFLRERLAGMRLRLRLGNSHFDLPYPRLLWECKFSP